MRGSRRWEPGREIAALVAVTVLLAGCAQGRLHARESFAVVDVQVSASQPVEWTPITEEIKRDVMAQAKWMNGAGRPIVMHITLDHVSFRSSGKALAGLLPFGPLVAGENVNELRGRVEIQQPSTGSSVGAFDTRVSYKTSGQRAVEIGGTLLSILPGPIGLVGGFAHIGSEAAASDAQQNELIARTMAADFAEAVIQGTFSDEAITSGQARRSAQELQRATQTPPAPVPGTGEGPAQRAPL